MTRTFLAALLAVLVLAGCAKTYEDYPDYRTWRQEQLVGRETGDGPADLGDDKSWHYWKLDSGQCVLDQIVTVGEKEVRVKKSFLFGSDAEMSAYIQKEKTKLTRVHSKLKTIGRTGWLSSARQKAFS